VQVIRILEMTKCFDQTYEYIKQANPHA